METSTQTNDVHLCEPQTAGKLGCRKDAHPNPEEVKCPQQPRIRHRSLRHLWENIAKTDIQLNLFQYLDISFRSGCCPDSKTPLGKEFKIKAN